MAQCFLLNYFKGHASNMLIKAGAQQRLYTLLITHTAAHKHAKY